MEWEIVQVGYCPVGDCPMGNCPSVELSWIHLLGPCMGWVDYGLKVFIGSWHGFVVLWVRFGLLSCELGMVLLYFLNAQNMLISQYLLNTKTID